MKFMSSGLSTLGGASGSVRSSIPPAFLSHLSLNTDLGVAIFLILTGVVSLLGNGIVLLVYCGKKKKLRPPELMTVNLTICDFGYSLLGAPFLIISSLSHGWVFGEAGCMWYGWQGFVFGIGSLITTCLISLDRCLKICSFKYGQWIERRHMTMTIGLGWFYTLFWASLPLVGFGSYGPEPFGTSCTINWWRVKSSFSDRVYVFLIMSLCFLLPTFTIIISYVAILLTVYRSSRTLASIASSTSPHTRKDLRLTKIAAVVCSTFLLSWMPYAIVSLYSALAPKEEQGDEGAMQGGGPSMGAGGSTGMGQSFPNIPNIMDLLNGTSLENYGSLYQDPGETWQGTDSHSGFSPGLSATSTPSQEAEMESQQTLSCLPPIVTLIPAMFAKSHCMMNPFIYQIMNKDFREDVYGLLFGRQKRLRRRRTAGSDTDTQQGSLSLSLSHSWRQRSNPKTTVDLGNNERDGDGGGGLGQVGERGSLLHNISVGWHALDVASLDTQVNVDGQEMSEGGREMENKLEASTCRNLLSE